MASSGVRGVSAGIFGNLTRDHLVRIFARNGLSPVGNAAAKASFTSVLDANAYSRLVLDPLEWSLLALSAADAAKHHVEVVRQKRARPPGVSAAAGAPLRDAGAAGGSQECAK